MVENMINKIDLLPPTDNPHEFSEYSWAASDDVAKSVIGYLLENAKGYFNKMSKDFSTSGVTSRNTLFGRLLRMEKVGIIRSDLVRISYGEEKIQKWVKEYRISEQANAWAKSITSLVDPS